MTRTFNEKIRCPKCGYTHTVETDFERWIRQHDQLDSRQAGIVRFDLDILLHKYLYHTDGKGSRDIQCMMFVELKTFMADPSKAQRDTLSILNQILRNRKQNIHTKPRRQILNQITKAFSILLSKEVTIKLYGGHLLQLDGTCPDNSSKMLWDKKVIGDDALIELLRFERDPDRPHLTIDHRRRSQNWTDHPMFAFMKTT